LGYGFGAGCIKLLYKGRWCLSKNVSRITQLRTQSKDVLLYGFAIHVYAGTSCHLVAAPCYIGDAIFNMSFGWITFLRD